MERKYKVVILKFLNQNSVAVLPLRNSNLLTWIIVKYFTTLGAEAESSSVLHLPV